HASGGTATLLALELFKAMARVDIVNIPFRGSALALTGTLAGETQMMFSDLATAAPQLSASGGGQGARGRLRTLAVTTRTRVPQLPEVATIDESGVPGFDVATWIGAFAPDRTPKAILGKLEADIKQALGSNDVRGKLATLHMQVK